MKRFLAPTTIKINTWVGREGYVSNDIGKVPIKIDKSVVVRFVIVNDLWQALCKN